MNNHDEILQIEALIRSAKISSPSVKQLRRRVVRSARQAERKRLVRRRAWSAISASVVAILLAHIVNLSITSQADHGDRSIGARRGVSAAIAGQGDGEWSEVEHFNREREKQSGVIRGRL